MPGGRARFRSPQGVAPAAPSRGGERAKLSQARKGALRARSVFFIHSRAFYLFHPRRILALIVYVFVFLKELAKANIDVALRALRPRLPLKPGIVKVPVKLGSEYAEAMLANSITLTPGTITVAAEGNRFTVHCLSAEMLDGIEDGVFVRLLRKMEA